MKFKEKTNNGDETGRAAYLKYSQNMEPLLAKAKARVIWAGNIQNTVIGDSGDQPDMVLLVEYPSVQHFVDMALSEAYKEIGKDREIALQYGGLWASKTINM